MYPRDTTPSYPQDTYGPCLYLRKSLFLIFNRYVQGTTWTITDNVMRHSYGSGLFRRKTGQNTVVCSRVVDTAGSGRPTWCAWSNTGADCDPQKRSPLEPRVPHRLLLDDREGLQ